MIKFSAIAAATILTTFAHAAAQSTDPPSGPDLQMTLTDSGTTVSYFAADDVYWVVLSNTDMPACKDISANLYIDDRTLKSDKRFFSTYNLIINTGDALLKYTDIGGIRPVTEISISAQGDEKIASVGTHFLTLGFLEGEDMDYYAQADTPRLEPDQESWGTKQVIIPVDMMPLIEKDPAYKAAVKNLWKCNRELTAFAWQFGLQGRLTVISLAYEPTW